MIPIDRQSKDPFFRYKMAPVAINNEASRTTILNLDVISKALHRNPDHIIKYLSISFGCTCMFTPKYALNGSFDTQKIQNGIYDFIDLFVLCKACRNPETKFVYESESSLSKKCSSCGAVVIQENHKLNTMISKDKDKSINEDTKYDQSNKNTLSSILKSTGDQTQEIYENYKQENWTLESIFSDYIKTKDMKQLSLVFKNYSIEQILQAIENMLEMHKKEDKIDGYLKTLLKMEYQVNELEEYFNKPRKDKKRSPLLKKNAEYFFDNLEEE